MDEKIWKIAIGGDHAGFRMKEYIKQVLELSNFKFEDYGTFSEESADYPDIAHPLSEAVHADKFKFGILICGSGNGMAIVANKYRTIRAAICWSEEIAKLARTHNDANILVLPARFISQEQAVCFSEIFLKTEFEGGRHQKRIEKISHLL
ncbi:MAG: ribose 5-phosphate isomerase B [Bacteroidales bacterium]|jgi:ribose 5-phosphate isomerase B|nr:ribose 5-phosphate isomerase B [Bacteroidales bacterium]